MKKVITIILVILLLVSIGFNAYFAIDKFVLKENETDKSKSNDDKVEETSNSNQDKKEEAKVFIQYGNKTITEDEFIESLVKASGNHYIQVLKDEVLKTAITEEELNAVQEAVKKDMNKLKDSYGDQLEASIKGYTNYNSLEEYQNYLEIEKALGKRAENKCKDRADFSDCSSVALYQDIYDILTNTKIKFSNKDLENDWEKYLETIETTLNEAIKTSKEADKETEDYKGLKRITLKDLKLKIERKETFVLLISNTACNHCQSFKPKINDAALKNNQVFNLIEVDKLSVSEYEELNDLISFTGTPTTCVYKDGAVASQMSGDLDEAALNALLKTQGIIK